MAKIFADTAGWGNLVDPSQPYHELASQIYRSARQHGHTFITTNYVLTELVALLTNPLQIHRTAIIHFIGGVKASPYVQVIHIDPTVDTQAWKLLTQRTDKAWSLVDCASFVVMQRESITEALTTDHHFEQAGFIRLLQ